VLRGARQKNGILVDLSRTQSSQEATIPLGILDGRFCLSPDQVQQLLQEHDLTEDQLLTLLISSASKLARPPISSFHVGAVGLGTSGAIYVGVNLEFARLPLYNSVHAEQFLLVNMLHHGEQGIRKLAISAAPCGHCRQFYSELACAETVKFYFQGGTYTLGQLLPLRFKPADLLPDPSTPLLLDQQNNRIEFTSEAQEIINSLPMNTPLANAATAALEEARRSYAPYSHCPAGIAIVTQEEGPRVYSGGYIESAAYNPSLPPLQTAIIDAVIDGMPCYTGISHVVLVELREGPVQHAPTTKVMLEQIAPQARLIVLQADWEEGGGPSRKNGGD
jgi:cytidine deaminase